MRLASVMEAREEYYAFELAKAARKLADEILEVKPGQTVAITADTMSDARVVQASAAAVFAAGGLPTILLYHTQPRPQMEPPAPVAAAVASADIWIEHAVSYVMYTRAWHKALDAGVQYCELGGMDADGMVRCIGQQSRMTTRPRRRAVCKSRPADRLRPVRQGRYACVRRPAAIACGTVPCIHQRFLTPRLADS